MRANILENPISTRTSMSSSPSDTNSVASSAGSIACSSRKIRRAFSCRARSSGFSGLMSSEALVVLQLGQQSENGQHTDMKTLHQAPPCPVGRPPCLANDATQPNLVAGAQGATFTPLKLIFTTDSPNFYTLFHRVRWTNTATLYPDIIG